MNNESECFTGISKHEKTMYENTKREWFSYIVFECLDIPVKHELEFFIWLLKWNETIDFAYVINKIFDENTSDFHQIS